MLCAIMYLLHKQLHIGDTKMQNAQNVAVNNAQVSQLQALQALHNDDDSATYETMLTLQNLHSMLATLMQINNNFANIAILVNDTCYYTKSSLATNVMLATANASYLESFLNSNDSTFIMLNAQQEQQKFTVIESAETVLQLLQNCNTQANTLTVSQLHAKLSALLMLQNSNTVLYSNVMQQNTLDYIYNNCYFAMLHNMQLVLVMQQEVEMCYLECSAQIAV